VAQRPGLASRRRILALLAGGAAGLAGPSRVVRAQPRTSVRIATGVTPPSIHNIWLHVAYERGFFRDNGIDVTDFTQLRGGPLALQAIGARQVDLTGADPEGLLAATVAGHPIRAVSAPGAHLSYIVGVRKEVGSVADLRGKAFAISRPGAISQYLMFPLLDRARVPRESVQWLGVGGGYERMLALLAGRVQGALLNVDFAMQAMDDPGVRLLQPVADILPEYPVELLVLRKELLDGNVGAATAITRAVIQACRYIVTNKAGTIEVALKYTPGMNEAVLTRAYDELVRIHGFGVDGGMTHANVKAAHDLALQNRQIARAVSLDAWTDFRFQERAMNSLGLFAG
jgi:ABC-type nitrate/sulfonate/bicarbonate transport system substrate-binding protein